METHSSLRTSVGVLLLGFGLIPGSWIVFSLLGLLSAETPPDLVTALTPAGDNLVVLGMPEGEMTIPSEVFTAIGYLITCFVYVIIMSLTSTLIKGGVAHAVTIGNIPSLEWFQAIPNGKSGSMQRLGLAY